MITNEYVNETHWCHRKPVQQTAKNDFNMLQFRSSQGQLDQAFPPPEIYFI